jgi:hypothetical protein
MRDYATAAKQCPESDGIKLVSSQKYWPCSPTSPLELGSSLAAPLAVILLAVILEDDLFFPGSSL